MANKITWTGASGTRYSYWAHKLPPNFQSKGGNYIYTKLGNNGWIPIYIGETGNLGERPDNHHKAACIKQKGATHIMAHLNSSQEERRSEESDLLGNYTNAYAPNGCNEKIGG